MLHRLPGSSSQKRYCALAQPVAAPVTVTCVPGVDGETGALLRVTEVHGDVGLGLGDGLGLGVGLGVGVGVGLAVGVGLGVGVGVGGGGVPGVSTSRYALKSVCNWIDGSVVRIWSV